MILKSRCPCNVSPRSSKMHITYSWPRSTINWSIMPIYWIRSSNEYRDLYDSNISTEILAQDALNNDIRPNFECLRAASQQYRLDGLMSAMLTHTPDPSGKGNIAVAHHVIDRNRQDTVVNLTNTWMHGLFLPSQSLYLFLYTH